MKTIIIFCCLWLVFGSNTTVYSQVSVADRKLFAENLNACRKIKNFGVSPYSADHISIEFNDTKYNGIRSVSNEFMLKANPNITYRTLLNLFDFMGANETIFNQFIYQVYLYNDGNKNQIIKTLKSFGGNEQLATRIYTIYWSKYSHKLLSDIAKNKARGNELDAAKSQENSKSIFDYEGDSTTKITTSVTNLSENISEPQFPGGQNAYVRFLQSNLKIPDSAIGINGTIIVEFTIDTIGKVTNAMVISNPLGYGLETEAIRVINLLPLWIPAKKNNISVPSIKKQTFTF